MQSTLQPAGSWKALAMDFPIGASRRADLWRLTGELTDIVLDAGGRFYFAKDATLTRSTVAQSFPDAEIDAFRASKSETDPDGILQSDLYRRLFLGTPTDAKKPRD